MNRAFVPDFTYEGSIAVVPAVSLVSLATDAQYSDPGLSITGNPRKSQAVADSVSLITLDRVARRNGFARTGYWARSAAASSYGKPEMITTFKLCSDARCAIISPLPSGNLPSVITRL